MKQLSVTSLLINLWTSFMSFGGYMSKRDFILSGLASMPLSPTIKPRKFPDTTLKTHLFGFNFILYFLVISKMSSKCLTLLVES